LHHLATVNGFIGFGFPFKVILNLHLVFRTQTAYFRW
jgi:hypothetical protein